MEKILDLITQKVSEAFREAGYEASYGKVTVSNRPDLCQFQCNGSFAAAKLYKKPPLAVAGEVAARLESDARIKSIEAVRPGFINITLTDEYLLEYLSAVNSDPSLGVPQDDSNKSIVMDYGGPNVAKSLHIGHLRSAIIGEAIKRIARAMGITVYSDVHLGNWGTPMGLVIAEYSERHPEWACFREDFDPERDELPVLDPEELNEIYPYASAKSKQDEAFKEKAHRITFELQSRRPGYYALWKQLVSASVSDVKKIFGALNVDFDLWYGESDSDGYIPELVSILDSKGLLHESEGALVVDVKREDDKITVPPVIIKKSDDSSIYATTDLATIIQRERDFKPDRIWYIVDKRQAMHFEQVFRCARKTGLVEPETRLVHIGFGTVNGSHKLHSVNSISPPRQRMGIAAGPRADFQDPILRPDIFFDITHGGKKLHGAFGDHRFRFDLLGAGKGSLKNRVQLIAAASPFGGKKIGRTNLSQNLVLSHHHGIHPAGDPVQMGTGFFSGKTPRDPPHLRHRHAAFFRKQLLQPLQASRTGHINLRPVAGGKQHRLPRFFQKRLPLPCACLSRRKREPFPYLLRRRPEADADTLHDVLHSGA